MPDPWTTDGSKVKHVARYNAETVKAAASIEAIIGARVKLKPAGAGELAGLCPFHQEKTPSFTVTPAKGLYHCFGCQASGDVFDFVQQTEGLSFGDAVERIAEASGVLPESEGGAIALVKPKAQPEAKREITATFEYVDEHGQMLYEVCRVEPGRNGRKKDFLQRRRHPMDGAIVWGVGEGAYRLRKGEWYPVKDEPLDTDDELPEVRQVLYNLPAVLACEDMVYIVEGEKDAGTLETFGCVATTNSGGAAKKWLDSYSEALAGKRVVILPDNDEPGIKRARAIEAALAGVAEWVMTVPVPAGKDITEWAEAGHTAEDFHALISATRSTLITRTLEDRGLLSPPEIIEIFDGGALAFLDPSLRKPGLATGFNEFDRMTVGLREGELVIVAGRPAMGKTALAMNIAEYVANHGGPTAVFSLEMSREQLLTRMVCSRARLDQVKFRGGDLSREDRILANRALHQLWKMPIGIDDQALSDATVLHRKLELFRQRLGGLSLVIVDYLQLMTSGRKRASGNRTEEVSGISRDLKLLAKEFRVPIIVLSQLSRGPESRPGDHRPQMSDLRESGSIEQDADIVSFVFREEYYKRADPSLKGKAEFILSKQRNGPTGTIPLTFLNYCTRFENPCPEYAAEAA